MKPKEGPSAVAIGFTLVSIGLLASLIALIALGLLALLDVGGFCAEGGPYVIEQRCPTGVLPAVGLGVPLLFVVGFAYVLALPTSWKPLIGLAWPVLFVALAVSFLISAFFLTDSFQVAPFVVGVMMAGIGIGPIFLIRSPEGGFNLYPDRTEGVPAQTAAILLGIAFGAWLWFFVLA